MANEEPLVIITKSSDHVLYKMKSFVGSIVYRKKFEFWAQLPAATVIYEKYLMLLPYL